MARYNTFKYGSGQTYGEVAINQYSAAPFVAYAQDYDKIYLSWNVPQPESGTTIQTYRILRNQYAYSETENDGIIIWDDTFIGVELIDENNLAQGRFAFYSFWIQLDDDSWILAGQTEVLVPAKHVSRIYPRYIDETNTAVFSNLFLQTTHERFMSYIPRIFTTDYSATDNPDSSNDLSLFLEGFSFTVDEFLTYGQLILPGLSGRYSNSAIVKLQGDQLGVPEDTQGLTKTQKYLVRDAVYIYSRKGTLPGLTRFVKALTGYSPTITVSQNQMLSLQDSTFYKTLGNWKVTNSVPTTALNTSDVPTAGGSDLVVESNWVAKIDTTGGTGCGFYLGLETPITTAIPVIAGNEYTLNFWVKKTSGSGSSVTTSLVWFDQKGQRISSSTDTGQSATSSWARKSFTATAPSGAKFVGINLALEALVVFYIDRVQFSASGTPANTYAEARAIKIYLNPTDDFASTRINKVPRLNYEITKYLPINTAYFITSVEGFESSGISS